MEDVIQRLQASKASNDQALYAQGLDAGKAWASNSAEAPQLENLEQLRDSLTRDNYWGDDWWYSDDPDSAYSGSERLFFAVNPTDNGSRAGAREFWQAALGDNRDTRTRKAAFLRGFAEGALEVWDAVKEKL